MAEYIEREALLKKINRMIDYCKKDRLVNGLTALFQASDAIIDCKAADVAPVRHGRWKRYGKNLGECSECGEIVSVKNNYCPACGCLML